MICSAVLQPRVLCSLCKTAVPWAERRWKESFADPSSSEHTCSLQGRYVTSQFTCDSITQHNQAFLAPLVVLICSNLKCLSQQFFMPMEKDHSTKQRYPGVGPGLRSSRNLMVMEPFSGTRNWAECLGWVSTFVLRTVLQSRCYYYGHFTGKDTEAQSS